jgi:hypothetical protein
MRRVFLRSALLMLGGSALPHPIDKANAKTVGIGYPPTYAVQFRVTH